MAGVTKVNPVIGNYIGEIRNIGKEVTMIAVDWDIDADASTAAMQAIHDTITVRANILMAGAVYDTGTKQDFMLEGDFSNTTGYVSADGTVTGTFVQALVEDIINLGTVDGVNFGAGTVAAVKKSTLKFA
tara:strand:+ start:1037 stop:1426 length:390 start_codon:yes stop_codon:yes gene_type:complete